MKLLKFANKKEIGTLKVAVPLIALTSIIILFEGLGYLEPRIGFSESEWLLMRILCFITTIFYVLLFLIGVPEKSQVKIARRKFWGLYLKDRNGKYYFVPIIFWMWGLKNYINYLKEKKR